MTEDADDARNQLLILTAALYAVRLFRSPYLSSTFEQDRVIEAQRSALDAVAIIAAVDAVDN